MNYKHSCVVNANGYYTDLVLVYLEQGENGETQENIQHYKLKEGERLVDAPPPPWRPHAGASGFIRPRWDGGAWTEGAAAGEIAAWETEHPAPVSAAPTVEERLADLEDAMTAQLYGGDGV